MFEDYFAKRLAELRIHKGLSARDMSLSLGQSDSYINKIENGKSFPSMQTFFYICEFLDVTPEEFFNTNISRPQKLNEATNLLNQLDSDTFDSVLKILNSLVK